MRPNDVRRAKAASKMMRALIKLTEEAHLNMGGGAGHLIDNARRAIEDAKKAGIVPAEEK